MKRLSLKSVILSILVLAISLSAQSKNYATFKFVVGDAQRLPAGQTNWLKASINGKVYKGDRIKTALSSRVEIVMPDETVIRVDQNSIFDIKEIKTLDEDNADEMGFSLWVGNIWAKFKKVVDNRQKRTVESPSAVVAIRGTTLEINVNPQQTTTVTVEEGLVAVSSSEGEGEVLVGSNQQTSVKKGETPSEPTTTPPAGDENNDNMPKFGLQVNDIPVQINDPSVINSGVTISGRTAPGARVTAGGRAFNVSANGQFEGKAPVNEGFNSIEVTSEKDGLNATNTVKTYINTRRPQITLSTPLASGFYDKRNYSLSGAVFDETPLDKIKVIINGDEVAEISGRGTFNRTIILQEGVNNIRISALDRAKNSTEIAERIFLDTVKPIITITEPAGSSVDRFGLPPRPPLTAGRGRPLQKVRGVIIDPEPSSKLRRILINGKEVKPNTDGSFEVAIFLEEGSNVIQVYVEDMAGNISRDNSKRINVTKTTN